MSDNKAIVSQLPEEVVVERLAADIHGLVAEARASVATAVNAGVTLLYWRIGKRLGQELLRDGRAEYGERILATLSQTFTHLPQLAHDWSSRLIRWGFRRNFEELGV